MKLTLPSLILIPLLLAACTSSQPAPIPMPTSTQANPPKAGETIAIIATNMGVIKMKFFPEQAPETVKNFTELSKKGFYNKLIFHRVIPDFMIQGGDPLGTGFGGETYKGPNTTLPGEVSEQLKHIQGAVSMANKGDPATATSQFFIVQNKAGTHFLDGGYTVFGQVYEGLDVVDKIAKTPRDAGDKPLKDVVMESVEITQVP